MPSLSNEPKFDFIHFRDLSGKAYSVIFQLGQQFTATLSDPRLKTISFVLHADENYCI